MTDKLKQNDVILFQGDSITDAGRDREDANGLGHGYAQFVIANLMSRYPELNLTCYNRGISGNRIPDLLGRWQADCIDLKPTWLSILIGINDVWRRYDNNDPTSVEDFEKVYRELLMITREKTSAKLILCEAFVMPHPKDRITWREDLDPKIEVTKRLAAEFDAMYVSFDTLFADAIKRQEPAYWAADGVHPTVAGHGLMAKAWLKTVGV